MPHPWGVDVDMKTRNGRRTATNAVAVAVALLLAVPALLAIAGCGGNTPQGAVQNFFSAWQANNWEAYKKAVNPNQKLTKNQDALAKLKFQQIKVKFQDLKMQSKTDPKDPNKATVTLVGGKVIYTADVLGTPKTDTQDISKQKDRPVFDTVKINGVWYVDYPLG